MVIAVFFMQSALGQDSLLMRKVITRTEISIRQAQKEMIAGHSACKPSEFSKAVRYQMKAVDEFKNGNTLFAACYSLKGRQYSNKILMEMGLKGIENYLPNEEELTIQNSDAYRELEQLFESRVPDALIGKEILLDAEKLSQNFTITLN
jgi:hypothetical protein